MMYLASTKHSDTDIIRLIAKVFLQFVHQIQALQVAVLGSIGMRCKEMSTVMLTLPSLPYRCRMTAIAQGILITKHLVVRIQHTPARNLREERLHQDFRLTQEPSWKPSSEDAGGSIKTTRLQSLIGSPGILPFWGQVVSSVSPIPQASATSLEDKYTSATTWNWKFDLQIQMPAYLTWTYTCRVSKWELWIVCNICLSVIHHKKIL